MKSTLTLIAAFLMFNVVKAQDPVTEKYDWTKNPVLHTLTEEEKNLPTLILKETIIKEFAYSSKDALESYWLHHVIIRVNSDESINSNNKIYLPYTNTSDMIRQKVRVIDNTGKVINLGEKDIKESKDEETESTYKYFALEGVTLGSEIEYYFLIKSAPNLYGSQIILQSSTPKKDVELKIISPPNIILDAKSYNGLAEMEHDSTDEEHYVLDVKINDMPGLEEEPFANRDANLQCIVYKIYMNTANNKKDIVRYSQYAESLYSNVYAEESSSVTKKIQKFIKDQNFNSLKDDEAKVRAVEQFIKTTIQSYEFNSPDLESIDFIIEKKAANEYGLIKLYTAIFNILEVDHQLVITSNRYDFKFDPEFESYSNLDSYLLYFPKAGKLMDPVNEFSRLGYIGLGFQNNSAIYVVPVEVGDFKSGVSKVKFIDALPYDHTKDILLVEVDLNKNISNPEFKLHREQIGYYAQNVQVIYEYLDETGKKDVSDSQVKFISEESKVNEVKLTNTGGENFGVKPLITDATFNAIEFVEKAGSNYIFNVGLLIGPQAEMYDERERVMEVENDFNRWYHRVIKFEIPDGYVCNNLKDLNMDVYQDKNGDRTMTFTSTYTQTGNTVEVTIDEYYKQIIWPKEEYEEYRKVINAAADFNKIALFLEKQ